MQIMQKRSFLEYAGIEIEYFVIICRFTYLEQIACHIFNSHHECVELTNFVNKMDIPTRVFLTQKKLCLAMADRISRSTSGRITSYPVYIDTEEALNYVSDVMMCDYSKVTSDAYHFYLGSYIELSIATMRLLAYLFGDVVGTLIKDDVRIIVSDNCKCVVKIGFRRMQNEDDDGLIAVMTVRFSVIQGMTLKPARQLLILAFI